MWKEISIYYDVIHRVEKLVSEEDKPVMKDG